MLPLCAASLVKDPIEDYLSQPDAPQNPQTINNGIQQMTLDVNGEKVLFISAHGFSEGGPGNIWVAYVPNGAEFTRLDKTADGKPIVFNEGTLHMEDLPETSAKGLITYLRTTNETGNIWVYNLSKGQLTLQKIRSIDTKKPKDQAYLDKYFDNPGRYPMTDLSPGQLVNAGYTLPPDKSAPSTSVQPKVIPNDTTEPTLQPSVKTAPQPEQAVPVADEAPVPAWVYVIVIFSALFLVAAWYYIRSKK